MQTCHMSFKSLKKNMASATPNNLRNFKLKLSEVSSFLMLHDAANEPSLSHGPKDHPNSQTVRMRNKHRHKEVNQGIVQVLAILHAGLWNIFGTQQTSMVDMSKASTQSVADTSTGRPQNTGVSLAFSM